MVLENSDKIKRSLENNRIIRNKPNLEEKFFQSAAAPAWGANQQAPSEPPMGDERAPAPAPSSSWCRLLAGSKISESASTSSGCLQLRAAAPVVLGRATAHRVQQATAAQVGKEVVRGSARGKRVLTEIVHSRPKDCANKMGTTGRPVNVYANYFRMLKKPNWSILHYKIDFTPDVDDFKVRRYFIAQHKDLFGGYLFDGTQMFSSNLLRHQNREGEEIQIIVKHVGTYNSCKC